MSNNRTKRLNQRDLAPWLFLAPGILNFLIYVIMPIFQPVWISFFEWDGLGPKTWVGLENYAYLLDDESFYTSLKNNIIWLVLYMLAIPAGLAVALFLNQTVAGIRLYKSLFFFPFVISQVVVGLIFSWFYAPDFGILPKVLGALTGTEIAVLADDRFATYGIIAAGLWPQIAYYMILYLTGLNNINPEQVEAPAWTMPRAGRCCGTSSFRSCGRPRSSLWSLRLSGRCVPST